MPNGYWGKILRVDLSANRVEVEEQDDLFYRRYFGGMGISAHYLVKELKPGVDPLGPDNLLVFAPGVISGVPIAGTGRNEVGAKSPMSGGFGRSEVGGFFGAELKHAGFDAIVVKGKADHPVYLWVHDGEVEIRDARHLWGQSTKESQDAIRAELGDRQIRTAQIGPGGENLVRFACVINDLKDAAGRTGMGAVMGAKNLKAVAARGHQQVGVANPEQVRSFARWAVDNYKTLAASNSQFGTGVGMGGATLAGNLPTRNFRDGYFEYAEQISAEAVRDHIRIDMEGCYGCPIRCKKVVKVDEPAIYTSDPAYGGPEYETLASCGSNCGVSELKAIARAHHLCQAYSLDTISTGATVAFAMECFENGLLTLKDTDGIDLRFGNGEAMVKVIEMIARRQGIGAILAEGTRRAAQQIGGGAEKFSMAVKGVELGMHEPRLKHGLGLGYCVVAHGADHCIGMQDTMYEKDGGPLQKEKAIGWIEPIPANELSARKAAMFMDTHNWRTLNDCAVMCIFIPFGYQQIADIIASVTGWNTSVKEALQVGERAVTLARVFNVREGFTREDDMLPDRYFAPPLKGALKEKNQAMDRAKLEAAKSFYYRSMGWDPETGVPTPEKLEALGIGWAVAALKPPIA